MINIGWLYPDLMNTYGDRGNIIALSYRLKKRGLPFRLFKIYLHHSPLILNQLDLIFMGGAQDRQQEIVNQDLKNNKGEVLHQLIEKGVPGLYVCGAYQFLGKYYKEASGKVISGLGFFDFYTENPGEKYPRCIGNIVFQPKIFSNQIFVGFENHGGRTFLKDKKMAFAKVVFGFGNNGQDKTEGFLYKNSIGTYSHGPILPKNPLLADWLIKKAYEVKYKKKIKLKKINDLLEKKAKEEILKRV